MIFPRTRLLPVTIALATLPFLARSHDAAKPEKLPPSPLFRKADLDTAMACLAARHNLEIDFHDERSNPTRKRIREQIILDGATFWDDWHKIEGSYDVKLKWVGRYDDQASSPSIVRLTDDYPKSIFRVLTSGDYRVLVIDDDELQRGWIVRLEWPTGTDVLAAEWTPDPQTQPLSTDCAVWGDCVDLGMLRAGDTRGIGGTIAIRTAPQWRPFEIELSTGAQLQTHVPAVSRIKVSKMRLTEGSPANGPDNQLTAALTIEGDAVRDEAEYLRDLVVVAANNVTLEVNETTRIGPSSDSERTCSLIIASRFPRGASPKPPFRLRGKRAQSIIEEKIEIASMRVHSSR